MALRKDPTQSRDSRPEIDELQKAHLAYYTRVAGSGNLVDTGPFLDAFATQGKPRGRDILKAASLEDTQALVSTVPIVKAGMLLFELHSWMIEKNTFP